MTSKIQIWFYIYKSTCKNVLNVGPALPSFSRYFSLQARAPLGFSDAVRFEVEQNICREEGPRPDCFESSSLIVLNVLDKVLTTLFDNKWDQT